ncbi:cytochrome c3 family protein [Novipirellula sp.]|uniref:cytochrome c3 family protein n=1 Tax=Novipirellula sp. TaxID=2795430 RepID=UPI00356501A4
MRETGKQRSQRIQIDYYRRRGGLHRFRTLCIAVGGIAAVLYACFVLAGAAGKSHLSTGPVAIAHASFENDCKLCHQNFTPISSDASSLDIKPIGVNATKSIQHIETACQSCHQVGSHYRETMRAEAKLVDQNCAGCHVDHQGRDHDLSLVTNERCASCHADLSSVCSAAPTVNANVVAFTKADHGDFASLQKPDPGVVKFDHAQHMRPGQVDAGQRGEMTLAMLDESLRDRYRGEGQDDSAAVQLDCGSCHQMVGNPSGANTMASDGELGRYMAPVSFEQHCSACHSMNSGAATADTTPIPHAVPWSKVDLLLAATIDGVRATGQARSPRGDARTVAVPGEGVGKPATGESVSSIVDVRLARERVQSQCLKCHDQASVTDEAIRASLGNQSAEMIPSRWFEHGIYDHAAHRRIDCKYCHEAAYNSDTAAKPATDQDVVMIAGIQSCTGCHRDSELPTPASLASSETVSLLGGQPTWASDRCTLCHRYHPPGAVTKVER